MEPSKPYFIFKSLFLTRNIVSPRANIHDRNSLRPSPPTPLTFFWSPPFQNAGLKMIPPQQKGGGDWYCVISMLSSICYLRWSFFAKIGNGFQPLTTFAKSSIVDNKLLESIEIKRKADTKFVNSGFRSSSLSKNLLCSIFVYYSSYFFVENH